VHFHQYPPAAVIFYFKKKIKDAASIRAKDNNSELWNHNQRISIFSRFQLS
jgi:hypothetical protein